MDFKVLQGGRNAAALSEYRFLEGEITDTRLMGVLGMYMHWQLPYGDEESSHLHLFFYYDVEELGLESVTAYVGTDEKEVNTIFMNQFGGLGAEMAQLSERECRWLANTMISDTKKRKLLVPETASKLDFITKQPVILSMEEKNALFDKMAVDLDTDYGVVNYYLMRLFGKDPSGAAWLVSNELESVDPGYIEPKTHCSFLKNTITPYTDENGRTTYLSESLIEVDKDNSHMIVVTDVEVKDGKVVAAEKKKEFKVSDYEASMRVSRPEFVTVYEIFSDWDTFDRPFAEMVLGTTKHGHDIGDMYMMFQPDNSHIEKQEFNLNDDVRALFFVTDFGQLIVGAYTEADIIAAEAMISFNEIWNYVMVSGRYQFADPIIFDFAQSGFENFDEFLKSLQ